MHPQTAIASSISMHPRIACAPAYHGIIFHLSKEVRKQGEMHIPSLSPIPFEKWDKEWYWGWVMAFPLVSWFSLASQPTSAWEGKGLVNWLLKHSIQLLSHRTGYCSPIRELYPVMWYIAIPNTRLTAKTIMMLTATVQWISRELFVGSVKYVFFNGSKDYMMSLS